MKRTHTIRSTGEGSTVIKISFTVTATTIEQAIMLLLDSDCEISKSSVVKKIKENLTHGGTDSFGVGFYDEYRWYKNVDELREEAEVLAKKLFPDFY